MRLLITSAFFILLNSVVYSQVNNEILDNITRKFQTYCESFPREEIFVQSDRDIYIVGEEIRFSIFLFDRQTESLTAASRIAYFEVLNASNRPVAQVRVGLDRGAGSGQVALSDTLSPGVYTLRAYTNWMKNFMPYNCFSRKIKVYGTAGVNNFPVPEEFREIVSEKDNLHIGISARLIKTNRGTVQAEIITGNEFRVRNNNTVFIFLQTHGVINYKSAVSLTGDTNLIEIPTADFIPGINQFTVFDLSGSPVCESYSFTKRDNSNFHVNVNAPDTVHPRSSVTLELEIVNPSSDDDSSLVSISVVPSGTKKFTGIEDYMVFGSEFGQLPDLFVEKTLNEIPDTIMNNFLAGIKSKWIDWNLILSETPADIKYQAESHYHYLYGSLFNNNTADSSLSGHVFLSIPGKNATLQYSVTAPDGSFFFALPADGKTRDLVVQMDEKRSSNKIIIRSSYSESFPIRNLKKRYEATLPAVVPKLAVNYRVMKIYKTFEQRAAKPQEELASGTKRFYGKPDIELRMADYIKLPTMQEVFFELLPGVSMKSEDAGYKITIRLPDVRSIDPLLLIDGVVIKDPALIYNHDPLLVEKIDVIKARYAFGDYMFPGLINIITTKAILENIRLPEEAVRMRYRAYEPEKKFNFPDYSSAEVLQSHLPDFRNTLYWNPKLLCTKDKKTGLSFYASDFISDYDIIVQGVSGKGRFISQKKSFKIQK